jgi:hypothetical protein
MGIGLKEGDKLEDHFLLGKPGNYMVNFYHNGYLISTSSFKIVE